MYTQCDHCKAIFRVTMKELTAAQGLLRCGECDTVFDAMKSLSTTLPEERRFAQLGSDALSIPNNETNYSAFDDTQSKSWWQRLISKRSHRHSINPSRWYLGIGLFALVALMLLQLLYSSRNWLIQQPLTAEFTHQACDLLGCELETPRDVRKISLLSRNVYSHPNTPNVLTISLSIINNAIFEQPYPLIEISFLDNQNKIVALRRFLPDEYIKDFNEKSLMPMGKPTEVLLNINDPGEAAVHFQFRFI